MPEKISTLSEADLDAVSAGNYGPNQYNSASVGQYSGGYFTYNSVNVSNVQQSNSAYTYGSGNNSASIYVRVG